VAASGWGTGFGGVVIPGSTRVGPARPSPRRERHTSSRPAIAYAPRMPAPGAVSADSQLASHFRPRSGSPADCPASPPRAAGPATAIATATTALHGSSLGDTKHVPLCFRESEHLPATRGPGQEPGWSRTAIPAAQPPSAVIAAAGSQSAPSSCATSVSPAVSPPTVSEAAAIRSTITLLTCSSTVPSA